MSKHTTEFKERFKQLMELRGIRQTDVVQRTGISDSTISKYVSGQQSPKSDKIDLIANTYGVNPAWLLGYDVPMSASENYIDHTTTAVQHSDQQLQRLLAYASAISRLNDNDRKIVEDMIDRLSGGDQNGK